MQMFLSWAVYYFLDSKKHICINFRFVNLQNEAW